MINSVDLENLAQGDAMVVVHPKLEDIRLTIRFDQMEESFIGVPVSLYGDRYVIEDNDGTIHNEHGVVYDAEQMSEYVNRLCGTETIELFRYVKNMERYGLRDGDVIEFHNGSRGKVIVPDFKIYANNVLYIPIKKDGALSKVKPRMLYGNVPFKIIR